MLPTAVYGNLNDPLVQAAAVAALAQSAQQPAAATETTGKEPFSFVVFEKKQNIENLIFMNTNVEMNIEIITKSCYFKIC